MNIAGWTLAQIPQLPTDWETHQLKGQPSKVKETKHLATAFIATKDKNKDSGKTTWQASFNSNGYLTEETYWDDENVRTHWSYSYDSKGQRSQSKVERPNETFIYTYQYSPNTIQVLKTDDSPQQPLLGTATYTFSADNQLISKKMQSPKKNESVRYERDAKGVLLSESYLNEKDSVLKKLVYQYDPNGNLIRKEWSVYNDLNSLDQSFEYDKKGMLAKQIFMPVLTAMPFTESFYTYNAQGKKTSEKVVNMEGYTTENTFVYDAKGRLVEAFENNQRFVYQYNEQDSIVYQEYIYNEFGAGKQGNISWFEFSPEGLLLRAKVLNNYNFGDPESKGDTLITDYTYDLSDPKKPLLLQSKNSTQKIIYTYSDKKQLLSIEYQDVGNPAFDIPAQAGQKTTYSYHPNGKIKLEQYFYAGNMLQNDISYDSEGNKIQDRYYYNEGVGIKTLKISNQSDYTYDKQNRLLEMRTSYQGKVQSSVKNTYDALGNLIKVVDDNALAFGGELRLPENIQNVTSVTETEYNAKRQPIRQTSRNNGNLVSLVIYKYANNDSLQSRRDYYPSMLASPTYIYKTYDAKGNWIGRTYEANSNDFGSRLNNKGVYTQERVFTYPKSKSSSKKTKPKK
jgi:hypothetical protein